MREKKSGILLISLAITFGLQGCSQTPEPSVSKNGATNQPVQVSNINTSDSVVNISNSEVNSLSVTNGNFAPAGSKKIVSKIPEPKIGSGGNDLASIMMVRGKLSSDKDLLNKVIVTVTEGKATLTGFVANEEQKKKAEELTKSVEGIKSVKNNLRVST